jgi:hypothetical protein
MADTIPAILASGNYVQVDLLIALPRSTDQNLWVKPSWRGYRPVDAIPVVRVQEMPIGLEFSIEAQFLPSEGIWQIAAVAVSYQGGLLFVAPMEQNALAISTSPLPIKIRGLINSVI